MRGAGAVQAVALAGVHSLRQRDLARDAQHHIGRRVEPPGAAVEHLGRQLGNALHRARDVVAQRVVGVEAAEQCVQQPPVGAVVVHFDLLPDDALLLGNRGLGEPRLADHAQQNVKVLVNFLGRREQVAGAVIAGKGVGRRAGLGVEGEGVALGRLAHFVLQEMRRTGGQRDLFAVQPERAVDGAEARGVNRVDAAVARHRAAEHGQAAGQHDAFTADGGSGARLGSGEALVIVIQHPRCLLSPACPARRSRRSRPNSCSSAASGAPRPS